MDPERAPPLPQSEIASPVHALDQDTFGTIQPDPFNPSYSNVPRTTGRIDTSNLDPYAGNVPTESLNSEKLEPIRSPLPVHVRIPEPPPNSGKRETGMNNERFSNTMAQTHNGIDWIVPTSAEGGGRRHTVRERLQPTIDIAIIERDKSSANAKWTGYTLTAAIGLQVLLGSLTTGLSALAASGGRSTASATTALGALSTLVASYLARARGSNEPDQSITRTKNLEQFIRDCQSYQLDYGHLSGREFDPEIIRLRRRFEEVLGNADVGRKLAPPRS